MRIANLGVVDYFGRIPADLATLLGISLLWEQRKTHSRAVISLIATLSGILIASLGSWILASVGQNWTAYPEFIDDTEWTWTAMMQLVFPVVHLASWIVMLVAVVIIVSAPGDNR